jgi:class 3 adenylate cyclase
MAEKRVERRLAAILAADVAGYSRLMGRDEEGTLTALKAVRSSLFDPKITDHRGRIVKTTGDGALAEFSSAFDAIRCAIDIQRAMAEYNRDLPDDRRIEFRIGINIRVTSSCTAKMSVRSRSKRSAQRCPPVTPSINWDVIRTLLPALRMLPSRM